MKSIELCFATGAFGVADQYYPKRSKKDQKGYYKVLRVATKIVLLQAHA